MFVPCKPLSLKAHGLKWGKYEVMTLFSIRTLYIPRGGLFINLDVAHSSLETNAGCIAPLGMDSGAIPDSHISASSQYSDYSGVTKARLHFKQTGNRPGGWTSKTNDLNQWLQVNIGRYTTVTKIATQGNRLNIWVVEYRLQYSDDGVTFKFHKEARDTSPKVKICRSNHTGH